MSEKYGREKYFTIHENDAGLEAYRDEYVEWLEEQIKYRDDIIGLSPDGDRHADLVAEIERLKERQRSDEQQLIDISMYLGKDARHVDGDDKSIAGPEAEQLLGNS